MTTTIENNMPGLGKPGANSRVCRLIPYPEYWRLWCRAKRYLCQYVDVVELGLPVKLSRLSAVRKTASLDIVTRSSSMQLKDSPMPLLAVGLRIA